MEGGKALLERDGYVVVPGLLPQPLLHEAREVICKMIRALYPGAQGTDLDALVNVVREQKRAVLGEIYDTYRETDVFRRLITAPELLQWARGLVEAEFLQSPFQHTMFRMDLSGEREHEFLWHQDSPYNNLSDRYVTAWFPLTSVGAHNGSIDVVPGSHSKLYPVDVTFKRGADGSVRSTQSAFICKRFAPEFAAKQLKVNANAGDVVFFHGYLVHRSGSFQGSSNRYSIQVRFGDLLAPEMVARNFRNRRGFGFEVFKSLHPELVESEER